jgi:hypothetical protein
MPHLKKKKKKKNIDFDGQKEGKADPRKGVKRNEQKKDKFKSGIP